MSKSPFSNPFYSLAALCLGSALLVAACSQGSRSVDGPLEAGAVEEQARAADGTPVEGAAAPGGDPGEVVAASSAEAPPEDASGAAGSERSPADGEARPDGQARAAGRPLSGPPKASGYPKPAEPFETSPKPKIAAPLRIRVGLATDLATVTLPCCGEVVATRDGAPEAWTLPLAVEPVTEASQQGFFRLQVAALKDERQARQMAGRLQAELGQPADARFDAASDLYRVRVGRYESREGAETGRGRLQALGLGEAWIVSENSDLRETGLRLSAGDRKAVVAGRWLRLRAKRAPGLRTGERRYRGELLVHLNDRGKLNLINELDLEDYLRGVVPKEMGPLLYNEIEALRAQAVAARTYTLRHLGEFVREGFDICATPRCQVYGGMDAEHPMTDRAIRQTAGEILRFREEPIDARFTATCGGRTEDIEVVFPRVEPVPYLHGVPCLEADPRKLEGNLAAGTNLAAGLNQLLVPRSAGVGAKQDLARRLTRLAREAGLPLPEDRLTSLKRREVRRFVASVFDLALDPRLFEVADRRTAGEADLATEVTVGAAADGRDARQARLLASSGLVGGPPADSLSPAESESLLFALSRMLFLLREETVRFLDVADGELWIRRGGREERITLPAQLATFARRGGDLIAGPLSLEPGDPLQLFLRGDRLVGVALDFEPGEVSFERVGKKRIWSRFRSDRALAKSVNERYPGLGFRDFEILERGRSGRVAKMKLLGDKGQRIEVEGLAVRWTFELPETLFQATRREGEGESGWLFRGRGWGHGVGMCQLGAFGMAQRGHSYREILAHYYAGADFGTSASSMASKWPGERASR